MFKYKTLFGYLSGLYCKYFILVAAVFAAILVLSNVFDILQKFKNITLSSKFFWKFVLYKVKQTNPNSEDTESNNETVKQIYQINRNE